MRIPLVLAAVAALALTPAAPAHFADSQIWICNYTKDQLLLYDIPSNSWRVSRKRSDGLLTPGAVAFTHHGHMLLANTTLNEVWELDDNLQGGPVLTAADGLQLPFHGLAIDADGNVYVGNFSGEILRFDENYQNGVVLADSSDGLVVPVGFSFLPNGDLLVANRGSNGGELLVIDPAGNVSTFDAIPGIWFQATAARDNRDLYALAKDGSLYHYPGGIAANRTLLATLPAGNGDLEFDPEHQILYHVNDNDGALRAIDPDTGVDTVLVSAGWDSLSLAIPGSQYPPGSMGEFGDGLAGSGGFVPEIHGNGEARIGQSVTIEIHEYLGDARTLFFLGSAMEETILFGGEFHIDLNSPYWMWVLRASGTPGMPGDGDVDVPLNLPNDPALVMSKWYFQGVALDPGSPSGFSISTCLQMYVGE